MIRTLTIYTYEYLATSSLSMLELGFSCYGFECRQAIYKSNSFVDTIKGAGIAW